MFKGLTLLACSTAALVLTNSCSAATNTNATRNDVVVVMNEAVSVAIPEPNPDDIVEKAMDGRVRMYSWDDLQPCTIAEGDYKIEMKGSFKQYLSYHTLFDQVQLRRTRRVTWSIESGVNPYEDGFVIRQNDKGMFNNGDLSTRFGMYIELGQMQFLNNRVRFPRSSFTSNKNRATNFYAFCTKQNPSEYYIRIAGKEELWLQRPRFTKTLNFVRLTKGADEDPPRTAWKFHSQAFTDQ